VELYLNYIRSLAQEHRSRGDSPGTVVFNSLYQKLSGYSCLTPQMYSYWLTVHKEKVWALYDRPLGKTIEEVAVYRAQCEAVGAQLEKLRYQK
jgi:hypothetical protein